MIYQTINKMDSKEYSKKFRIENIGNHQTDTNLRELINVLEQLTDVNVDDIKQLRIHINNINNNKNINMFVVKYEDKIIGSGTVLIEDKIIHNFGKVAHIEDVVIDSKFRGNGLAKKLINKLTSVSKKHNCYKIILNASDNVKPFYEKLGFIHHTNSMRIDLL